MATIKYEVPIVNEQMMKDILNKCAQLVELYFDSIKKQDEIMSQLNNYLKKQCDSAVRQFYSSYDLKTSYKRKNDLYNAYKIYVEGDSDTWRIEFGPEFMKKQHRVYNEYIYINSFEKGWHGGSIGGNNHPNPGTPYWRTPSPRKGIKPYAEWWKTPAAQSKSPKEIIDDKNLDEYINNKRQLFIKTVYNPFGKKLDEIVKLIKKVIGG